MDEHEPVETPAPPWQRRVSAPPGVLDVTVMQRQAGGGGAWATGFIARHLGPLGRYAIVGVDGGAAPALPLALQPRWVPSAGADGAAEGGAGLPPSGGLPVTTPAIALRPAGTAGAAAAPSVPSTGSNPPMAVAQRARQRLDAGSARQSAATHLQRRLESPGVVAPVRLGRHVDVGMPGVPMISASGAHDGDGIAATGSAALVVAPAAILSTLGHAAPALASHAAGGSQPRSASLLALARSVAPSPPVTVPSTAAGVVTGLPHSLARAAAPLGPVHSTPPAAAAVSAGPVVGGVQPAPQGYAQDVGPTASLPTSVNSDGRSPSAVAPWAAATAWASTGSPEAVSVWRRARPAAGPPGTLSRLPLAARVASRPAPHGGANLALPAPAGHAPAGHAEIAAGLPSGIDAHPSHRAAGSGLSATGAAPSAQVPGAVARAAAEPPGNSPASSAALIWQRISGPASKTRDATLQRTQGGGDLLPPRPGGGAPAQPAAVPVIGDGAAAALAQAGDNAPDLHRLAEQVTRLIVRRLDLERERRGGR